MTEDDYQPLTRDLWVCRVCRRPLDLRQFIDDDDTVVDYHFEHTLQDRVDENHAPDPVRAKDTGGEIVGRCDFCNQPGPIWRYPCTDFSMTRFGYPGGFVGDWAACDQCHRRIEAGRWAEIAKANAKTAPSHRNEVRRYAELLHAEFRKHRAGPAVLTYGKIVED